MDTSLHVELIAEAGRLSEAESILGYSFAQPAALLCALTHRSYLNEHRSALPHNERLELLGDAVLSLVTVEQLLQDSPSAEEGELTDRRAAYVSTTALAAAARLSRLEQLLRTGNGVRVQGRLPENLAADVVEAVFGAAYEDGGLTAARIVVERLLGPPPQQAPSSPTHKKRVLQERLQSVFGAAPEYVVERDAGPSHAPVFRAEARFGGAVLGEGRGNTKRAATEAAASAAVGTLDGVSDATLSARFRR